jgi:Flp pilus assembly protein TadG
MRNTTLSKLKASASSGLLQRLRDDKRGNVIVLTAASVFPIMGVVGGSIDISRGYMAKTRLQAACDAGALAGRKAMATVILTTDAKAKADKMFAVNFPASEYDATAITFSTAANATGRVDGTAGATVPTIIMGMFGNTEFNLNVTCSAELQVPNIDVMMVLDVTGSMENCPDDSPCASGSGSKIVGLRDAVRSFYTTLSSAAAASPLTQLRFGFVPYSQTVNGKDLFVASPAPYQLPLTQLVDTWGYQSRVANFTTPVPTGPAVQVGSPISTTETYRKPAASIDTPMSFDNCSSYEENQEFSIGEDADNIVASSTPNPAGSVIYLVDNKYQTNRPASGDYQMIEYFPATSRSGWNDANQAAYYRTCSRTKSVTNYNGTNEFKFTDWTYKKVNYNVTQYKDMTAVNYVSEIDPNTATVPVSGSYDAIALRALPNQTGMTSTSVTWPGCLEERDTVAEPNFRPIPDGAKDLNFIEGGINDQTKWRPMFYAMEWNRPGPDEYTTIYNIFSPNPNSCPVGPMRNLNRMTLSEIDAYLPLLQPSGNTYHDIGMVWGLRLITPNGMFASRNTVGNNGGQISRHIIFMTDGELFPLTGAYSSYGIESLDKRITGSASNLTARHAARFQALCDAARSQQLSVWVIAFSTALTSNLTSCADPGRAFLATNNAELNDQFRRIANDIADLRLTK